MRLSVFVNIRLVNSFLLDIVGGAREDGPRTLNITMKLVSSATLLSRYDPDNGCKGDYNEKD